MVFSQNVLRPNLLPSTRFQAIQCAFGAKEIDFPMRICRRRPRTITTHGFAKCTRPAMSPNLASGLDVVRGGDFLLPALLNCERQPFGHRKRRVATTNRLPPHTAQPRCRPIR